ncbi:MAG: type IV conjugative transfer system lipoprotein TraV [Gammaproteobacteria bacterium]|nr:type IV conjugative transfer system lipoprotein TraV [Gammaproteobacteria bacterium]MDH5730687.1 type IV conjugative transfer system lipoprotein TraV [Gammaproteobacteria bacterium]
MKKLSTITLLASLSMLSGCASILSPGSSEYGCKGYPTGVKCMSAREVYEATEYKSKLKTVSNRAREEALEDFFDDDGIATKQREKPKQAIASQPVPGQQTQILFRSTKQSIPIRTPSKVARVWFSPWEDTKGRLHMESIVFMELEKRRWNIGEMSNEMGTHHTSPLTRSYAEN